ncbi:MAG: exodeoxyribonuclease VII small subunit [Selenomonadaceae bacterium]|nr:exodeoxyribonuclease VII small subunit [Selenomonadaceae bacterium]
MPRKKEAGFEEKLSQLEDIVSTLEQGNISLEDIMKNYSNGMEISRKCLEELQRAEKEMDVLIKLNNGQIEESELDIKGE